jgi:uncharacterized protein (UPF0335 family)
MTKEMLENIIARIEKLEEEKAAISQDIKDVYSEAKGNGLEVSILRKIVSIRKKSPIEREQEETMLELYMGALGMLKGKE